MSVFQSLHRIVRTAVAFALGCFLITSDILQHGSVDWIWVSGLGTQNRLGQEAKKTESAYDPFFPPPIILLTHNKLGKKRERVGGKVSLLRLLRRSALSTCCSGRQNDTHHYKSRPHLFLLFSLGVTWCIWSLSVTIMLNTQEENTSSYPLILRNQHDSYSI